MVYLINSEEVKMNEKTIFKIIDLLMLKLQKEPKLEDTIILSGAPRGGTTWLMEILETLSGYKSIFEPFHREWYPEVKLLNLPPRPYLPSHKEHKELKNYLQKVFTGQVPSPKYRITPAEIYRRFTATKVIVKFIRANRLLPWIVNNFQVRGTYFLIRHPCAVISSQLETGIRGYFTPKNIPLKKEVTLQEASQIPQIREDEWLMKKLRTIESQEEVLATIWSLDNYIPLSYLSEYPDAWYTIVYEKLVTDFDNEIKKIFEYINEEVPEKAYEKFKRPSKTTYDKSYLGTPRQLLKWKKKLSEHQVKNILKVVHWFGLDFYTENPEPDYSALRKWKPKN